MSPDSPRDRARLLFVDGERLRLSVEQPPSGGGSHFEPQTALEAQTLLLPQVLGVASRARQLPDEMRGVKLYIEAQLLPNYLAPSHFPGALLSELGAVTVGSRSAPDVYRTARRSQDTTTRRLILAVDDDGLNRLQRLVEEPGQGRSEQQAFAELRKLDDIGMREPSQVVVRVPEDETEEIVWESVLHPATNAEGEPVALNDATVEKWFALVEQRGGTAYREYVRRVGGLTFAPVMLRGAAAREVALFNPLRTLRPMPPMRPAPNVFLRTAMRAIPPSISSPLADSPRVAVFDGGVDNRTSRSRIFPDSDVDVTTEGADAKFLSHGTAVVGATLYGIPHEGTELPRPALPITSFRMFPTPTTPGLDEYWFLDQISEAVENGDYRIVNLSLGPRRAVEDSAEPDRWTSELDHLASERDVLFVVAAGNDGDGDRVTGLHRVQIPGDMVNGLGVGASNVPPPESPWERAEYSSMGPGRHGNRVQPAGLQFGGEGQREVPLLTGDGSITGNVGTSFAAPLVTHALSHLTTLLPKPTASVLRAFAVHFAEQKKRGHTFEEHGYGRLPMSFEPHLNCSADEAHVLFEDVIDSGDLFGYRIPIPSDVDGPVELLITLAYASPIEASQPTEYTRVSLDMALRPHQFLHGFNPPAGSGLRRQTCDFRTDDAAALLRSGWMMSQEPVTRSLGSGPRSPEIDLRDAGKWETVRRRRIRLRPGEFENPRIELSYVARSGGRLVHESSPVRFALLVTMRDQSHGGQLYDLVETQFPTLRALAPISARARLQTRSR
jgi:hypothetical protein